MTQVLTFDVAGVDSVQSAIRHGIVAYATDCQKPYGMSNIWLLLGDKVILKIHVVMTDTTKWNEVGTLVFRRVLDGESVPHMTLRPSDWSEVVSIEKLVVEGLGFSAESGLAIKNSADEILTIVPSVNVYQIEISAPFFSGEFLPEYALTAYTRVPM